MVGGLIIDTKIINKFGLINIVGIPFQRLYLFIMGLFRAMSNPLGTLSGLVSKPEKRHKYLKISYLHPKVSNFIREHIYLSDIPTSKGFLGYCHKPKEMQNKKRVFLWSELLYFTSMWFAKYPWLYRMLNTICVDSLRFGVFQQAKIKKYANGDTWMLTDIYAPLSGKSVYKTGFHFTKYRTDIVFKVDGNIPDSALKARMKYLIFDPISYSFDKNVCEITDAQILSCKPNWFR